MVVVRGLLRDAAQGFVGDVEGGEVAGVAAAEGLVEEAARALVDPVQQQQPQQRSVQHLVSRAGAAGRACAPRAMQGSAKAMHYQSRKVG